MRKDMEQLCGEFGTLAERWESPRLYSRLNPLDAVFAFRLLLGRNPNREEELPRLIDLSQATTLREFLATLTASEEFSQHTGFMPPDRLLMAELPDYRFWFNTRDTEMGVKMGFGKYEPETVEYFRGAIKAGMTCWDVGAQTGFFTCLFSYLTGRTGQVYAFEPLPASYEIVVRNLRENGFQERVVARNIACSDERGFIPMRVAANMYVVDKNSPDTVAVECVRLDEIEARVPDLIKIDVEGHEPAVLRGLSGIFDKCDPTLVLELNEYWLGKNSDSTGASVLRWLNDRGFTTYRMEDLGNPLDWEGYSQGELGNCNVVATRDPHRQAQAS